MLVGDHTLLIRLAKQVCCLQRDIKKLECKVARKFSYLEEKVNDQILCLEDLSVGHIYKEPGTYEYKIPDNISTTYVTMVAGGGAGSQGILMNGQLYSGAGGGAGACMLECPVQIPGGTIITIHVGRGGSINIQRNDSQNTRELEEGRGEESWIVFEKSGDAISKLTTLGGMPGGNGVNNHGGLGGSSRLIVEMHGASGEDGLVQPPSMIQTLKAGDGAPGLFSPGGLGGFSRENQEYSGTDGKYGSGGGGSSPLGDNAQPGKGGDGFVSLKF